MSTEVLEPPPVVTEPNKITPPPAATPDPAAVVASLLKPNVRPKGDAAPIQNTPPVAKVDPPKEQPKVEQEKPKPDAEKNWAELRAAREAAEKLAKEREEELNKIRTEYESYKKNPIPKEFEEKLTKAERERAEYQKELRAAALVRDPEFQRKYAEPIKTALVTMQEALTGIAEPSEVQKAISQWNEAQFAEWNESLPLAQKMRFNAAYMEAVRLDNQRTAELSDSEKAWEELSKSRQSEQERQQKLYLEALRGDTKSVLTELSDSQEIFKNDPELQKEVEGLLNRATGLEGEVIPRKQLLKNIADAHVLSRHFQRLDKEHTETKAELEKLKKDLAERDAFIKGQNLAIPGINPTVPATTGMADDKSVGLKFLRPSVRV